MIDQETEEQLGDVTAAGQRLLVAKGGNGGWGNARYKSSTNRTPRKAMPGLPGEKRDLRLELKVMAHLRDERTRPLFELEESEHPLSHDYRVGITEQRLHEIYEANLHAA